MSLLRIRLLACLVLAVVSPVFATGQASSGFWEVQMLGGQPYLTVEAIQRNYGFTDLRGDSERFELSSSTARLEGRTGASSILLNRLRYELHYPLEARDGRVLVSAYDLSNLIDLLFRPGEHLQASELKTIYLQTDSADGLAAKPVAAEMVLALQEALASLGFDVRPVPVDAKRISADLLSRQETGAAVWLRLRGNPKLPAHYARCAVLAPPESPKRKTDRTAVYAGNLADAESLALATLLQSGLVFGPGAKVQKVTDGAIAQDMTQPFERAPGAAVLVEWGKEFGQDHLLKSLAAGVVRYQGFLEGLVKQQAQRPKMQPEFFISTLKLDGEPGGRRLAGTIQVADGSGISLQTAREPLQLQFYLFAVSDAGKLELLQTPPEAVRGESLTSASDSGSGALVFEYALPEGFSTRLDQPGAGYAVRLLWQGKEQDVQSWPRELSNQLGRFTGLYP